MVFWFLYLAQRMFEVHKHERRSGDLAHEMRYPFCLALLNRSL